MSSLLVCGRSERNKKKEENVEWPLQNELRNPDVREGIMKWVQRRDDPNEKCVQVFWIL